jgi:hypothetical protein
VIAFRQTMVTAGRPMSRAVDLTPQLLLYSHRVDLGRGGRRSPAPGGINRLAACLTLQGMEDGLYAASSWVGPELALDRA